MNILPKKRWHVRTKDNIARVRRDEAQAADEEKEKQRRAKLAEQEARTALLRRRVRGLTDDDGPETEEKSDQKPPNSNKISQEDENKHGDVKFRDIFSKQIGKSATTADIYTEAGNVNFFKDLESGLGTTGSQTNKEHEAEERAEKEKYEKQIGLLTYLGQDSLEASKTKAWYNDKEKCVSAIWAKDGNVISALPSTAPDDCRVGNKCLNAATTDTTFHDDEVGLKYKRMLDPLTDIIKYIGWKPSKSVPVELNQTTLINLKDSKESNIGEKDNKKLKKLLKKRNRLDKHIIKHSQKLAKDYKNRSNNKLQRVNKKTSKDSIRPSKRKRREYSGSSSSSSDDADDTRKRKKIEYYKRKDNSSSDSDSSSPVRKKSSKSSARSRYSSSSDSSKESLKQNRQQLATLRKERLAREAVEHLRAQRFLNGQHPDKPVQQAPPPGANRQKYNSQFNPTLARQNKEDNVLKAGAKYF